MNQEDPAKKKVFIARAIAWAAFACGLPVAFIGWRYDLFRKVGTLQLSGWGLFALVIVFFFLRAFIKYIKAGLGGWSMTKQIINGITSILLPLGALLAVCVGIRSNIDYFVQALCCTLMCEALAIPMNPFPEWVYEKSKGRFESMLDMAADRLNSKKKEEK